MSTLTAVLWQRAVDAWPWIARALTLGIVVVVSALLFKMGREIDWREVFHTAANIPKTTLMIAGALVCFGYAMYACIDFLARKFVRHALSAWESLAIGATSYAINQNLGVLLGGIGVRLRLYRKLGLPHTTAAQVVLFSSVTNWLGYCWLAGLTFISGSVPAPAKWGIKMEVVPVIGAAMLIVAVGYVILCATSSRRHWSWRTHHITLPSVGMALTQSGVAIVSWCFMGLIIYILLERQIPYAEVLSILLFCSIAAIITHIPGGLGVTEAIFVAALAGRLPDHQVLAAVLMYRVVYQWIPFCIALPAYIAAEIHYNRPESLKRVSQNGRD